MSVDIQIIPIRFIHWDYVEFDMSSETDSNIQMMSGPIKDGETEEKKGLYIRWVLRVYLLKRLTLSCIAEQGFIIDVDDLNEDLFINITKISNQHFKEVLSDKIKETNLTVGFQVDVTHQEAYRCVRELREQ